MKAYLAARYSRHAEMRGYAEDLEAIGIVVTSRWILGNHDILAGGRSDADRWRTAWAAEDWNDLTEADLVISFTEAPGDVPGRSRGGRHVEFGIALAREMRCIVVGYRENVFHHLPEVEFYPTWAEALSALALSWTPEPATVQS